IFPRKVDFSCFGYHPDLESRLTFQEARAPVGPPAQQQPMRRRMNHSPGQWNPAELIQPDDNLLVEAAQSLNRLTGC
ncbi:hypothetical protein, partial [Bradyrhizobium diazoefficiens]|uniref:hypothetical protein n=1 Tax=Bradyrhizobium diazoefficiens TaxID=1355477 RepID=UPI001B8C3C77